MSRMVASMLTYGGTQHLSQLYSLHEPPVL